jgi:hypothetical protein
MINQTTPHLQLPLPHPDNRLDDDVVRLRGALTALDGAIYALRGLVSSDDLNLDTVQEIVTVLKGAQGDIGNVTALLATKADKTALAAVALSVQPKADTSYVDAQLTARLRPKAEQSYVDTQLAARTDLSLALLYTSF